MNHPATNRPQFFTQQQQPPPSHQQQQQHQQQSAALNNSYPGAPNPAAYIPTQVNQTSAAQFGGQVFNAPSQMPFVNGTVPNGAQPFLQNQGQFPSHMYPNPREHHFLTNQPTFTPNIVCPTTGGQPNGQNFGYALQHPNFPPQIIPQHHFVQHVQRNVYQPHGNPGALMHGFYLSPHQLQAMYPAAQMQRPPNHVSANLQAAAAQYQHQMPPGTVHQENQSANVHHQAAMFHQHQQQPPQHQPQLAQHPNSNPNSVSVNNAPQSTVSVAAASAAPPPYHQSSIAPPTISTQHQQMTTASVAAAAAAHETNNLHHQQQQQQQHFNSHNHNQYIRNTVAAGTASVTPQSVQVAQQPASAEASSHFPHAAAAEQDPSSNNVASGAAAYAMPLVTAAAPAAASAASAQRKKITIRDANSKEIIEVNKKSATANSTDGLSRSGSNAGEGKPVRIKDATSTGGGKPKGDVKPEDASKPGGPGGAKNGTASLHNGFVTEQVSSEKDSVATTVKTECTSPHATADFSKVDINKVVDFVPTVKQEPLRHAVAPKLSNEVVPNESEMSTPPRIDKNASAGCNDDVTPSPTVTTTKADGSCPGQEVKIYDFTLGNNSQAVIETTNGSVTIKASPTATPGAESEKTEMALAVGGSVAADAKSSASLPDSGIVKVESSVSPFGKESDSKKSGTAEDSTASKANGIDGGGGAAKEKEPVVIEAPATATRVAESGDKEKEQVGGKKSSSDKMKNAHGTNSKTKDNSKNDSSSKSSVAAAAVVPDEKPDSTGSGSANSKQTTKGKKKKKEKDFEKRGESKESLLSAYESEPSGKDPATGGTPVVTNTATLDAVVSKPNNLSLETNTQPPPPSTAPVSKGGNEGAPLGSEGSTAINGGSAGANGHSKHTPIPTPPPEEKPEEETSWEDKTVPDETPEEEKKGFRDSEDSNEARHKIYDRDFLLSIQKNPASLVKAAFTQHPDFREIVTHQPQFLKPLSDTNNTAALDFRDTGGYMGGGGGGHNSYGGSHGAQMGQGAPDFAPDFLRRKPAVGGPTNSRGKQMGMNGPGNMQSGAGGASRSFRNDRGSLNQPRLQFTTNAQNTDIRIQASENAYVVKRKQHTGNKSDAEKKTDTIKRQTRSILNKLTPQNFSTLSKEMAQLDIDTDERVSDVIDITFEKACLEPNFAEAYANICKTVLSMRSSLLDDKSRLNQQGQSGGDKQNPGSSGAAGESDDPVVRHFRRNLLNRCQQEFQREKDYEKEHEEKKAVIENSTTDSEKEKKEKMENLNIEMRKSKKKSLGNIRFIGELFKLDFLTEKIMHSCIESLLKTKDDDSLECLCKLLSTIGRKMDHESGKYLMEQYFKRIQTMVQTKVTSSRIRFFLQDIIDLRKDKWESKKDSAPKTIEQIHKDAHMEDLHIKQQAQLIKFKDRQNNSYNNDRKYSTHSNRMNNEGPASQQEWQTQTVSNKPSVPDVRAIISKTHVKTPNPGEFKLGGGSGSKWSKGSGGASFASSSQSRNASGGAASSQGGEQNRFNALQNLNYGDESPSLNESNRSSSVDLRNSSRGPTEYEKQQSKDEVLRLVQNLDTTKPTSSTSARGMSPSFDSSQNSGGGGGSKFASSGVRFAGATGSSGSGSGRSSGGGRFNSRDSGGGGGGKVSSGATYPSSSNSKQTSSSREVAALSEEALQNKVSGIVEEFMDNGDVNEYCDVVATEVPQGSQAHFVKVYAMYAIERKERELAEIGRLLYEFARSNTISLANIKQGILQALSNAISMSEDIPKIWKYYALLLSPLFVDQLSLADLPHLTKCLVEEDKARLLVAEILVALSSKLSSQQLLSQWTASKLTWREVTPQWTSDSDLNEFLEEKKLLFSVIDCHEAALLAMLMTENLLLPEVFDYIQHNLRTFLTTPQFIRLLTKVVCRSCIDKTEKCLKFDDNLFEKRKNLLSRFVNLDEQLSFHCIYSVQLLVTDEQHPQGLLDCICKCLVDNQIVIENAFTKWKEDNRPEYQRGKGTCIMQLTNFFNYLEENGSDSD